MYFHVFIVRSEEKDLQNYTKVDSAEDMCNPANYTNLKQQGLWYRRQYYLHVPMQHKES